MINVNELIHDRIRWAEMAELDTGKVFGRITSIEDGSLQTSAEGEEVTDSIGSTIDTIYRAKKGKFTGSNSLFSLDLLAAQYGTKKEIATTTSKIAVPGTEILDAVDGVITLTNTPNADIKYIYKMNNRDLATTFEATSSDPGENTFVHSASGANAKKIQLAVGTTGKFYVKYFYDAENAVKVDNSATKFPETCALTIYSYFKDPCNTNIVYSGSIITTRAKLSPESVETVLTTAGKHGFEFNIQKPYCDETEDNLFSVIIAQ